MDPLIPPTFLLLLLEQGERSLEDHAKLFLAVANCTSCLDNTTTCRAPSSKDVLRRISPGPLPTQSPTPKSPHCAELKPEPTDDREPIPAAINKSAQCRTIERRIAPEAEPTSDQVQEPVTMHATREQAVDGGPYRLGNRSGGRLALSPSSLLVPSSPPSSPVPTYRQEWALIAEGRPVSQKAHECSPTCPLRPPPPLSSGSPVGLPSSIVAVAGPPLARTPPQPVDPPAPSSLASTVNPPAPPGSLVPPPQPPEPSAPPCPPGSSAAPCLSSTTCSAAVGQPPGVGGHSSSMAPPSIGSTVGHRPTWLLLLQVPPVISLAPSSIVLLPSLLPSSHPCLPLLFLRREDIPSGSGAICWDYGLFLCCVLIPMCSITQFLYINSYVSGVSHLCSNYLVFISPSLFSSCLLGLLDVFVCFSSFLLWINPCLYH
ncbi:Accumulation-associated protein [Labeo rohita]|uniref:Accumulation-associated protein n=1 Tax=Labeo rohita TaxID=84645 RepID=A0ABQ8M9H0_LABRO|nr:Accumulation-associated protein [Labeo rohita]